MAGEGGASSPSLHSPQTGRGTDLDGVEEGAKLSQKPLPHVVAATSVGQDQNRRPAAAAGRRQLHRHTNAAVRRSAQTAAAAPRGSALLHPYLTVLVRVSAPELVDAVEVVRRDDQMAELAQVAPLVGQLVHAVIVHCGLTPHTPEGD